MGSRAGERGAEGTDAYWQLNDARFAAQDDRGPDVDQTESQPQGAAATTVKPARTCEIPGYPSPDDVQSLTLRWCGAAVGFRRRALALQAAGAWCAIAGANSSSPSQLAARYREINTACDRLDAMQSVGTPSCRCPAGYRP